MNMLINKNLIRKSGSCILAGILVAAVALPLQAQSQKGKKEKKIRVPETALVCPYSKEDIYGKINRLNEWISAWKKVSEGQSFDELLASTASTLKNPKRYRISDLSFTAYVPRAQEDIEKKKKGKNVKKAPEVQSGVAETEQAKASGTFYYLTSRDFKKYYDTFGIFLRVPHLTDDMLEATERSKQVFLEYDKAVKKVEAALLKLEKIKSSNSRLKDFRKVFETEFKPALKEAAAAYTQLQEAKRMAYEQRQAIENRNRERRREAYINKEKRERKEAQQEKE